MNPATGQLIHDRNWTETSMRIPSLLCVLALAGCGVGTSNITQNSTFSPPEQSVRIAGIPQPVRLGGSMETSRRSVGLGTAPNHNISITLNGESAAQSVVETYQGGVVAGRWRGMAVNAICTAFELAKATRRFDCAVAVNEQVVGTLGFHAWARGSNAPVIEGSIVR